VFNIHVQLRYFVRQLVGTEMLEGAERFALGAAQFHRLGHRSDETVEEKGNAMLVPGGQSLCDHRGDEKGDAWSAFVVHYLLKLTLGQAKEIVGNAFEVVTQHFTGLA